MNDKLRHLSDAGVSVWLDDLSRELIEGGELARLVDDVGVVGITSNPTIVASARAKGDRYAAQMAALAREGADVERAVFEITTEDVRRACDVLAPVFERTGGVDGRVSLEVDPRLAHDTDATVAAARTLWATVDRPNLLIKIPATLAGLPAITTSLAEGISVNVTLIFSLDRYRAVMNAYLTGLERARAAGRDLSTIASVASFFVSRLDTEVDRRLDALATPEAAALRGKAALANARLAYHAFEEVTASARWQELAALGARPQRPLWASTGVKDPQYPDTLYVTELVAPGTVNTMPGGTLSAVADHAVVAGDTVRGRDKEAAAQLDALAALGIGYAEVTELLEREGVDKFEKSWAQLLETISGELARAATAVRNEEAGQ
jgi:transaldolase